MTKREFADKLLDNGVDPSLVSKIEVMCDNDERRQCILQLVCVVRRLTGLYVMENMKEMLINVLDDVGLEIIDSYKEDWKNFNPK